MTDGDGLPDSPAFSGRRSHCEARRKKFAPIRRGLDGYMQTERLTWESVCIVQAPMGWRFDFTLEPSAPISRTMGLPQTWLWTERTDAAGH